MTPPSVVQFGAFQFDLQDDSLWHGPAQLKVTAKATALLRYLVTHPHTVINKAELFAAVWPDVVVSDWALSTCVRELRAALGDKAKRPRVIETVHRRGYRFIGKVVSSQQSAVSSPFSPLTPDHRSPVPTVVGRDAELAQLYSLLDKALHGERQIVFVTGEPGIGKTTLIEAFLQSLQSSVQRREKVVSREKEEKQKSKVPASQSAIPKVWVARGQCIESYGVGEAYRPVLEALGRLSRSEARPALKAVLERYAPSWLLHLPALLSAEEAAALQPRVFGVMRERMVRELAEALEVFTTTQSLVLVFEDLHWADASTLTLLSVVAHRQEPARLLILATYRSTEAAREGSPLALLTQELAGLARSQEVAVGLFDEAAMAAYIETRFPVSVLPTRLAQVLYQRTEGNPLFVVSILQDLITRGVIGQSEGTWAVQGDLDTLSQETPEGIRQLVSSQRVRLQPKARRVLEAASVAGMEFSAAEVAAALEVAVAAVEERCARLAAQQQFLRPAGVSEWPDHTLAARYAFLHALYQQHWYEQVSPSRLQAWHQRIGERKEAAYGERVEEIAAELAVHFEQGRDVPRTLRYLQQAGENALRRNAYTESIGHLRKGLTLLPLLPDSPQRAQQELRLQATLSMPLILTKGYASPEVGLTCSRALTLCQQAGEVPQLFPVLFGLFRFYIVRGDVPTARQLSEQLMLIAQQGPDELTLPAAHAALAGSLFHGGDMVTARTVAEQGVALYDRQRHGASVFVYGEDPGVICQTFAAWSLFPLGYPHQAQRYTLAAVTLAQQLSHPFILAGAFTAMMITHELSRDAQAGEHARVSAHTFVAEPEFPHISASYAIWQGWRLTIQGPTEESIAEIRRGLAQWRSLGAGLWLPLFLGLLAEALGSAGQEEEGLATIAEALATASDTGQHWYDAELYRLYGELSLRTGERERGRTGDEEKIAPSLIPPFAHSSPEECFLKAIEIARQQEAKMWELRAVMSLVRLRQRQATQSESRTTQHEPRSGLAEAHQMLSEVYGWFTEGFDTGDLQAAKVLLEELQRVASS